MAQKQRNVAIYKGNNQVYAASLPGASKLKRNQYIRELMAKADELLPFNTQCELHFQQNGAKIWGRYAYTVGSSACEYIKG